MRLCSCLVLCLVLASPSILNSQRPNVVFIVSDDQAFGDYGFAGHPVIQTPHLDRLAAQSAHFRRGYVPTALCRPSLASMVTGLWPHRHGVTGNDPAKGVPRRRVVETFQRHPNLMTWLGKAGYASMQTGKWWEGSFRDGGFTAGMTHGDPKRRGRHGDLGLEIGRKGMKPITDFLDRRRADQPFFLWYAPFLPHTPHNPPRRLVDRYRKPGRSPHIARYYAMCTWFDETVGTLLEELQRRGLAQNTLVVFVADNGWIQKPDSRGFAPRSKRTAYEGGVRTPILLRWPGRIAPGVCDTPVSSIDLAPTVLAACDLPVAKNLDGVNLLPIQRGEKRRPVFGASFDHDILALGQPARSLVARFVVDGNWKFIARSAGRGGAGGESGASGELYDLEADPMERRNLAGRDPDRVARLTARLDGWWRPAQQATGSKAKVPAKKAPAASARDRERTGKKAPSAATRPPNLLLVLTDDQRSDMVGCAGHPILKTPHIDSLAGRGVRFTNSFVTTSICAASRATLLTGRYRGTHGFTFGTPPLRKELTDDSYPARLRAAGYRTGFVGKFGMKVEKGAAAAMFDVFRPLNQPYLRRAKGKKVPHLTDRVAAAAVEFVAEASREQPFCLSVSFHAPHAQDGHPDQFIPAPRFASLYADAVPPAPQSASPEFFAAQPAFLRTSLGRVRWGWRFDSEAKRVRMTRNYYRMISGVDAALGRILEAVRERGDADNTVVVFTSDNGYFLGDRGFAGKWLIYEPSIRVPLIIADPRAARRGTEARMALNVDLPATLLELAGLEVPAAWQGRSLVPLLSSAPSVRDWPEDFFYEHRFAHPKIPPSEGVRGARYTYVRYYREQPVYEELFDRVTDPRQERNLIGDPAHVETAAAMRARCRVLAARYAGM